MNMIFEWLRTVLVLPFSVLVIIPSITLYFTGYQWRPNAPILAAAGWISLGAGLFLAAWTMRLFDREGEGTAAPWAPPRKLVTAGPYGHVRNPMISSVLLMLIGEALLLNANVIFLLFFLFFGGNMIYFPFFEEKDLEKRFGQEYLEYKRNVPRWIPRLTPWKNKACG
ncbi:MAG: isoprenylcysteine carboxylmethyltransferase family protein [Puniceicoccales bacterium]|jgi:protein-S-isoprenylcysteine O-methyltransferase Ste14|nr:isoprenylcysteine carboxylmethyltransferase family protein [Puniceicoccales bacterium]